MRSAPSRVMEALCFLGLEPFLLCGLFPLILHSVNASSARDELSPQSMPQRPVFYSGKVKPSTGNDGSGEPVNRTSSRVVDECRISAKSAETPVVIAS